MLVGRKVFAMQEIADESIEELIEKQGQFLGNGLFLEDAELKQQKADKTLSKEVQACWRENMISNFVEHNAEQISFSTDFIVFEKDVKVSEMNELGYQEAAMTYMELELGKIDENRIEEYRNFIEKVISLYTSVIHFKIIKIGSRCYSFFHL